MTHTQPSPPSDLTALATSTSRWIRLWGVGVVLSTLPLIVLGGAALAQLASQPAGIVVGVVILAFAVLGGQIAKWHFQAASRVRAGIKTMSSTTFASAFVPIRKIFVFGFILNLLGLLGSAIWS